MLLLASMTIVIALMTGCSKSESQQTTDSETTTVKAEEKKVFNFGLEGDVVSLDPLTSYSFSTSPVVSQMLESWYTYVDNVMVPTLATGYTLDETGTVYTFTFRDDVHFWDGSLMTAEDVVYSIERIMDPDNAGYTAWMHGSVDTVEATGEYEVTVTLKSPDATWLYATATNACAVVSKAYCEEAGEAFGTADGGIMGTGAYMYDKWIAGQEVLMLKNENYWDEDNQPFFDEVHFYIFLDHTTRLVALNNGELDATFQVPSSQKAMVNTAKGITMEFVPSVSSSTFFMNCQRAPLDDVNVRKAVSSLFDKEGFNKGVSAGVASPGTATFLPEPLRVYGDDQWEEFFATAPAYDYDMDKAAEYLAASAYPDGVDIIISIVPGDVTSKSASLALQEAGAKIGINFKIEEIAYSEYVTKLFSAEREYDIILVRWDADFPEPSTDLIPTLLTANTAAGGGNFSNYKNAEVDRLLLEQLGLTDDSERLKLILEASQIVAEEIPYLIFEYPLRGIAINDKVTGYSPSPFFLWEPFAKYMSFK